MWGGRLTTCMTSDHRSSGTLVLEDDIRGHCSGEPQSRYQYVTECKMLTLLNILIPIG